MFTTVFAALAVFVSLASAAPPEPVTAIVEVDIQTASDLARLAAVGGELLACEARPGRQPALVARDAVGALEAAGLGPVMLHPDADAAGRATRDRALATLARGDGDWWADFKPPQAVIDKMYEMQARRPDLVEVFEIGRTWEDRPILAMRITGARADGDPCRPAVLLNSVQHAREWITVMVNMWVAESLIANYGDDPYYTDLVDRVEWVFVPVLNPDGYAFTWEESRFWRKNRRPPDPEFGFMGVDLNRNWSFMWGRGHGSSNFPGSETYRGPSALSEPETSAMAALARSMPQLRAHNDMHSFSEMVLFPWGWTYVLSPDHDTFQALGEEMRERIRAYRGRIYDVGPCYTTIYPVRGGSLDYFYGDRGVWSFSYELYGSGFDPPPGQIRPNAEETLSATLLLGEFVADRYGFRTDLDGNCDHDYFDLARFLALFGAGDSAADFDGSGTLNFLDVADFVSAFVERR
jgi:murein tripeptide amidase MpaA